MDENEKLKNIRALIVLISAFITVILNIKQQRDTLDSMVLLLVVVVIFMVVSSIAVKLIIVIKKMDNKISIEDNNLENKEEIENIEG